MGWKKETIGRAGYMSWDVLVVLNCNTKLSKGSWLPQVVFSYRHTQHRDVQAWKGILPSAAQG